MKHGFIFAALLVAGPALARPNPTPPPSGIVVHLFGPNSVSSNFLPAIAPRSAPAGATSESGEPTTVNGETANGAAASGTAAAPSADDVPTVGQVLHQMFVVGDPSHKPSPNVPGRAADQPRAFSQ